MSATTRAASVRWLAARYIVADAYDRARSARAFDTTHGRRRRALYALERALNVARREARDDAGVADELLTAARADTVTAVDELARKLLQRWDVSEATIAALQAVVRELDVPTPAALERALELGGRTTGGSRARLGGRTRRY